MMFAIEAALVAVIVRCVYRAGVVRERARWVGFVRWTATESDGDPEYRDRVLGASYAIESRGWS